ncbi:MAG: deoxyhypusine synthase [Verrucomicrobia bacterium]|nr:deoxyhypusine synthase [Verrucomicrobiota bacterium]
MTKQDYLSTPIEHIDITTFDATPIIDGMRNMSFSARDTANAADIYGQMLAKQDCTIILTIAGSTAAAGCLKLYADLIKHNMVDVIVATGATIVDMDFFEALGYRHYRGTPDVNDNDLREAYVDRIYDTFIDEHELQNCDQTIKIIADAMDPGVYSSRAFIKAMGAYLQQHARKPGSLIAAATEQGVPIFCPAFSDCSAGFGLVMHQHERPDNHVAIDSVRDFRELTAVKMAAPSSGLFMIGGGVPKNFAQDTVVCAELLGREVPMHEFAVQITVADSRDGACSSSTLKEASSWGKVDTRCEQMVYAEATTILPLIASHAYHSGTWKKREPRRWQQLFA